MEKKRTKWKLHGRGRLAPKSKQDTAAEEKRKKIKWALWGTVGVIRLQTDPPTKNTCGLCYWRLTAGFEKIVSMVEQTKLVHGYASFSSSNDAPQLLKLSVIAMSTQKNFTSNNLTYGIFGRFARLNQKHGQVQRRPAIIKVKAKLLWVWPDLAYMGAFDFMSNLYPGYNFSLDRLSLPPPS